MNRNKIIYKCKAYYALLLGLTFCAMFISCKNDGGTTEDNRIQGIENIPEPAKRQDIKPDDIIGTYKGEITVFMDGKSYGPYTETTKIKGTSEKAAFISGITKYPSMPVDISFVFKELKITYIPEEKIITFTSQSGEAYMHTRPYDSNDNGTVMGHNNAVNGIIYKANDKVKICYKVVYDTVAMHKNIPLLPANSHNSMYSQTKAAEKQ